MKLRLGKCNPEKYSELIKPWVLVAQGFSPPEVAIEAPLPISVVRPEDVEGNTFLIGFLVFPSFSFFSV